tara:strand:- start:6209 stop:7264 length:1056 start_codon:yes stop_codon:yes gene_type:complete
MSHIQTTNPSTTMNINQKNEYNYFASPQKITLINMSDPGRPPIIYDATNPDFDEIKSAVYEKDWEEVDRLIANPTPTDEFNYNGSSICIEDDEILYNGEPLNHGFAHRLREMRDDGLKDATPWLKFLERVMKNPSQRIRESLHTFVEDKHMALTEEGMVLAYKGVDKNGWSICGNKSTKVLQGPTDENGKILNQVGESVEVERASVDDNPENTCSNGLHVGDYDYASNWGSNGLLLLVEWDPADAVSVPIDGQKLRVCKYKVLKSIQHDQPLKETLYQIDDDNDIHPMSNQHPSYERARDWIKERMNLGYTVENVSELFSGLSRRDVGRLIASVKGKLTWDDEINDYVISQ